MEAFSQTSYKHMRPLVEHLHLSGAFGTFIEILPGLVTLLMASMVVVRLVQLRSAKKEADVQGGDTGIQVEDAPT